MFSLKQLTYLICLSPLQLAHEVRDTLSLVEGQMEQTLANSLFTVYRSLQAIHKDKAFLQKRSEVTLSSTASKINYFY